MFHHQSLQFNLAFRVIREIIISPCKQKCFWIWPLTMFWRMLRFMIAKKLLKLNSWNSLLELFYWSPNLPGCFSCVTFCSVQIKFLGRRGWGRVIVPLIFPAREGLFRWSRPKFLCDMGTVLMDLDMCVPRLKKIWLTCLQVSDW